MEKLLVPVLVGSVRSDRQGIKAWYGTRYLTDPTAHYKGDTSAWQRAGSSGSPASHPVDSRNRTG